MADIERYSDALNKAFEKMYQASAGAQQGGPQGPFQGGPQGGPFGGGQGPFGGGQPGGNPGGALMPPSSLSTVPAAMAAASFKMSSGTDHCSRSRRPSAPHTRPME